MTQATPSDLQISVFGPTTEAIDQHVTARVTAAADQHARSVQSIDVRCEDLNGPRGGVDKQVTITARLRRGDPVIIRHADADLYAAVSHAADRLKNVLGRRTKRA